MIQAITKVRGKYSKLLKEEQYRQLLQVSDLESAFELILSSKGQKNQAKKKPESVLELENLLKEEQAVDLNSIFLFLNKGADLYKAYILKYEIRVLIAYVRMLISRRFDDLENLADGPYAETLKISKDKNVTFESYIEKIKKSVYYRTLKPFIGDLNEDVYFYISMALDRLYFNGLTDALKKNKSKKVNEYIREQIDIFNMQYIYRILKHYESMQIELQNFMVTGGIRFSQDDLKKFSKMNLDQFLVEMRNSKFAEFFVSLDDFEINNRIFKHRLEKARNAYRSTEKNILPILGYVDLLEFEISDINRILEIKKIEQLDLKPEVFLIRKLQG